LLGWEWSISAQGLTSACTLKAKRLQTAHFTPLGNTLFTVGFVVGFIGIVPWKIYARNYVCQVCSAEFGGGKNGKLSRDSHYMSDHPDFYNWDVRWIRWTDVLALSSFVYIIGGGQLVAAIPSKRVYRLVGPRLPWRLSCTGIGSGYKEIPGQMVARASRGKNSWSISGRTRKSRFFLVSKEIQQKSMFGKTRGLRQSPRRHPARPGIIQCSPNIHTT